MHRGRHREFLAERLLLRFQIRQVLEVIGVDITVYQQLIGVHTVGDFDDFEVELRIDFLDIREDLRVGHRVGGNA